MAFTHLHVHTEYSLLDGAAKISKLLDKAKELGMTSMAITDHGVMYGCVQFYEQAKKLGIKPIIGCEVYTAARTRFDKDPARDKKSGHLILLVKDNQGYKNLIKIVSNAYKEGFYYHPRVDHDLLRQYSGGLICLSACLAGKVQQELLNDNYEGAKKEALELIDIFGKENFYLEIQDHSLEEDFKINPQIFRLSEDIGVPVVATNDSHYINQSDAYAHDVLLCIGTKSNMSDPDRYRFANDQFYVKSEQEMRDLFAAHPEVCDITEEIAARCNFDFEFGNYHIPVCQVPEGYTQNSYFEFLCWSGLEHRYGTTEPVSSAFRKAPQPPPEDMETLAPTVSPELRDRMRYEISTIEKMGYVGYHLIVWDYVNWAKGNGIMVGPGRGSGAGAVALYSLEITDIDPMRFNLIFERFLNIERVSMPDIDMDFCIERRGEIIDYVKQKYGIDNVCQISTFGTLKARAAFKDVARVMEVPFSRSLEVAKMIPEDLKITLEKAIEQSPDFKKVYEEDEEIRKVIDTAKVLEGLARNVSTHAAGVVISSEPVDEVVPLVASEKGLATQFTMTEIEHLGLLKMDFLGLRNLTAIRECMELIKKETDEDIDLSSISTAEPEVYKLIASGNTTGIFQLESGGMTGFMKDLGASCLEDLIAGISLYRPGPMDSIPTYVDCKKHPEKISYLCPELEPILAPTYGCIVYQEQVMDIVRKLGGYSYGRADLVRRAMSKKKADVMAKEREYFINGKLNDDGTIDVPGCIRNGIPADAANTIFDQMTSFAAYAFNKSHAAAYAVVAYQTAWLKYHYPAQFLASLMTYPADADAVANLIRNAGEMGIEVLPPDVNRSVANFSTENGKIRYGLQGVKHVGGNMCQEIIKARERKMPKDIFEFVEGLDVHSINRTALECLIKAGGMDCFPGNRAQKLSVIGSLIESAQQTAKDNIKGQLSLFQMAGLQDTVKVEHILPPAAEIDKKDLLLMEKEMLGVYLTNHPLKDVESRIRSIATVDVSRLKNSPDDPSIKDGGEVTMAGLITAKKSLVTKKGQNMAFLTIEDLTGTIEVIVFPKTYELDRANIEVDRIVVFAGKLDLKEEGNPKVLADRVVPIEQYNGRLERASKAAQRAESTSDAPRPMDQPMYKVVIPGQIDESAGLAALKKIVIKHRGDMPIAVLVLSTGRKYKLNYELWVDGSPELTGELERVFGEGCVRV